MILSVSRRTDIPAFYSDWFFARIKDGYTLCENPFFPNGKVAKIKIEPVRVETNLLGGKEVTGNVDGIIFWTKNPKPMLARLDELKDFKYYFHYTLTPYDDKIEVNVPPFQERIVTFQELSKMTSPDQVIWRYDPILLNKEIDVAWHIKQFENIAKQLSGYTKSCMVSFLIPGKRKDITPPSNSQQDEILKEFARITRENEIQLHTCALENRWKEYGIKTAKCTDPELFAKLNGGQVKTKRLDGQRKHCGCMPCVDIGVYNTCTHNCIYCYANGFYAERGGSSDTSGKRKSMHDKLDGEIYERKTERVFEY